MIINNDKRIANWYFHFVFHFIITILQIISSREERKVLATVSSFRGQISCILENKLNQLFMQSSDVNFRNLKSSSINVYAVGCFKTGHWSKISVTLLLTDVMIWFLLYARVTFQWFWTKDHGDKLLWSHNMLSRIEESSAKMCLNFLWFGKYWYQFFILFRINKAMLSW